MPKYEQGQISAFDFLLLHAAVTTAYQFSSCIFRGPGLGGNDAIMYKDWRAHKPLVIYS